MIEAQKQVVQLSPSAKEERKQTYQDGKEIHL